MKKTLIIHPFLFAIFPIMFLVSHNIEQMPIAIFAGEIAIPIAITACLALLSWSLLSLVLRDKKKAGLVTSLFLLLFFSYGHVYDMVEGLVAGRFVIGRHRYLLLIWGIVFALCAYFIIRTRRNLHNLTGIVNIVAVSLVAVSVVNIGAYEFKRTGSSQDIKRTEDIEVGTVDLGNAATPDIYYIILDSYASSSSLKEFYDYDNHEFTGYLIEKGFYVASESHSNYALTSLSLASSLSMEYINDIVGESRDPTVLYQMISDNRAMRFLKSKGYRFIHFSSGWGPTDHNQFADLEVQCGSVNEFLMVLIQTTPLALFEENLIGDPIRKRILCTFSKLAEVRKTEGPKFVFAHINSPHPPYVFGANGEAIPKTDLTMHGSVWAQKERYLNQLVFITKKTKELVGEILSKSEVSPIIILQADHGTASTFRYVDRYTDHGGKELKWDRPTETNLKERMRVFNAYYLPSSSKDLLYDSITPVNTFRSIFNFYFDTNYELLKDKSYFSNYEQPYEFTDVTDILIGK